MHFLSSLPNIADNFAAYSQLAGFLIGDNALYLSGLHADAGNGGVVVELVLRHAMLQQPVGRGRPEADRARGRDVVRGGGWLIDGGSRSQMEDMFFIFKNDILVFSNNSLTK